MTEVCLSEVAEINPRPGKRPDDDVIVSFLGMADVDAETGTTTNGTDRSFSEVAKGYTPFQDGDLVVAKITPCFENGKIAQARLKHQLGMGSTEFHVIRPDPSRLDARYALHLLRGPEVRRAGELRMTGSAGQKRVPEGFLHQLPIWLPDLAAQRRIADILDRADALCAERRRSIALMDELARSIFIDTFVGHASDAWLEATVGELVDEAAGGIRTGPFGSQLLHSEFVDDGVAVLGIDNAVENRFTWGKARYVTEQKYQELRRYTVRPGDVVITIMGTCGRVAVVPDDIPTAINTKHLCCITLDRELCLPEFLRSYFLFHPDARSYLEQTAKGAIMSGLNMGIIKALLVRLPPIAVQQDFVSAVSAVQANAAKHEAASRVMDGFFGSLRDRAFRGEL